MISKDGIWRSRTSMSTMRWSSLPSRRCARSFSRVRWVCSRCCAASASVVLGAGGGDGGSRRSSTRSSAACSARSATSSSFSSRTISMEVSTRSRTIDSTSRPTYPTSVYFEASTLTNGQPARRARRRAISVLPTPVGPIIRIFFGRTSSAISGGNFWRRTRFRKATATARFAAFWPTMYLSSSATISRGVMSSSAGKSSCSDDGAFPLLPGMKTISLSDLLVMKPSVPVAAPLCLEVPLWDAAFRPNGLSLQLPTHLQLFDREVGISIDANFAGDSHGFHCEVFRGQLGVLCECARGGRRVGAAGTNGADAVIGLDDVAVAGEQKCTLDVSDDEQRL